MVTFQILLDKIYIFRQSISMAKKKTAQKKGTTHKSKKIAWWKKVPVISGVIASLALFILCGLTMVDAHTHVLGAKVSITAPPLFLKVTDSSGSIHRTFPLAVLAISVDSKPAIAIKIPFNTVTTKDLNDLSNFGIVDITAKSNIKVRLIALSNTAGTVVQQVSNGKYIVSPSDIHFNLGDVTNSLKKSNYLYCVSTSRPCEFAISVKSSAKSCTPKAIDLPYCCGNNMCQMYKNKNCLNSQIIISKNVKSCMPRPTPENEGAPGPGRHPF